MDRIYIHGLRTITTIGILDWERSIKQTLVLDLELTINSFEAALTDDIEKTVNYKDITDYLIKFIADSEFLLIEAMAEAIARVILSKFPVFHIRLKLGKPGALHNAQDVGIIIERSRLKPMK